MGAYFTGIAGAALGVICVLRLLTYSQEEHAPPALDSPHPVDAQMATLSPPELLAIAVDSSASHRIEAVLQLVERPGELDATVPTLAKLTLDRRELVRIAVDIVLKKIGPEGAPHVREMMESGDSAQNAIACAALGKMGGAELYLPLIKTWLSSPESSVRRRGLFVLQGAGAQASQAMEGIAEALKDSDFNNQCMACRVLEKLGPEAMAAEDELLELLNTGNPSARSWAAIALGAMGPTDKTDTARVLANRLDSMLQIEKQRALIGLAHLGPEASSVQDEVRSTMNDSKKRVMPQAAYTLWRITADADEPLKVLKKWIDDPTYSEDSVEFIGKFQSAGAPLVGLLTKKIADPIDESMKEIAVVALGNIGPPAASATGAIKKLLHDPDALVRYAARESLKQITAEE